jgi:hypothetical protein
MISKFLSAIFKRKKIPKGEDVEKHPAGSWDIWFKLKMSEDIIPEPNPVHLEILLEQISFFRKNFTPIYV